MKNEITIHYPPWWQHKPQAAVDMNGQAITDAAGRLKLGAPGASGHGLVSGDSHVGGALEVDGIIYADGNVWLKDGGQLRGTAANGRWYIIAGPNNAADAYIEFNGSAHPTTPGRIVIHTLDTAGTANIARMTFVGKQDASEVQLPASGTFSSQGTGTAGLLLKDLKNYAASTLSGTTKTLEVNIDGTAYYWAVSPTKV